VDILVDNLVDNLMDSLMTNLMCYVSICPFGSGASWGMRLFGSARRPPSPMRLTSGLTGEAIFFINTAVDDSFSAPHVVVLRPSPRLPSSAHVKPTTSCVPSLPALHSALYASLFFPVILEYPRRPTPPSPSRRPPPTYRR